MNTETSLAIVPTEAPQQALTLFGAGPVETITKATQVADALKQVILKQGLISKISGKEYPRCEAWTLLGTMLGVFPICQWTRPVDGGWEARVEARTRDGSVVGAAEAQCLRTERNWASRDDFALRSMAQTRATAKALRMPLGFVMTLAGFEAMPAEEMVSEQQVKPDPQPQQRAKEYQMQPSKPMAATKNTRDWMLKQLSQFPEMLLIRFAAHEGFIIADPAEWPLDKVPTTRDGMLALIRKIEDWQALNDKPPQEEEPFLDAVITVPRAGSKRAEYMQSPDTIRSLYDAAKSGDNSARTRLWGLVNEWEPRSYVGHDGNEYPPSAGDLECRKQMDAFKAWHEEKDKS